MSRSFKYVVLYFGLFGVFLFLFAQLDVFRGDRVREFSKEQEEKLSGYFRDVFVNSRTVVDDEAITEGVRILKDRLMETLDEPKYDYQIYVVRNRSVNAFALPGGVIVLHTGLFHFAETPEEVAAVLAHEIGHSELDHIMNKLIKEIGFGVLFAAITGGDAGIFSELGRRFITTRFDREYEIEADEFAMDTLEAAGINPRYMAVFFHRLSESDGDIMDRIDFISTHPSHSKRRQAALARELDDDFEEIPIEAIQWELIKALVAR